MITNPRLKKRTQLHLAAQLLHRREDNSSMKKLQ